MTLEEKASKKISCPKCKNENTFQLFNKLTSVDDMSTGEDFGPPPMPGGMGGMPPGMGGMGMPPMGMGMPGCGGGMCGPGF